MQSQFISDDLDVQKPSVNLAFSLIVASSILLKLFTNRQKPAYVLLHAWTRRIASKTKPLRRSAPQEMRLVQLSDPHLVAFNHRLVRGQNPLLNFQCALQQATSHSPDLLLITGDLCHDETWWLFDWVGWKRKLFWKASAMVISRSWSGWCWSITRAESMPFLCCNPIYIFPRYQLILNLTSVYRWRD